MHIRISATDNMYDALCTPDGERLPVAALCREGIESFLVDYDHKIAVRIENSYEKTLPRFSVNTNMQGAPVFYMHEQDRPRSQTPIKVGLTIKQTKEMQEWKKEALEFAKSLIAFRSDESIQNYGLMYKLRNGIPLATTAFSGQPTDFVNTLSYDELYFLNKNGFATAYDWHEFDHLIIK